MELYNVQRFNRQALHTPPRSEDEVIKFNLAFRHEMKNTIDCTWNHLNGFLETSFDFIANITVIKFLKVCFDGC